MEPEGNTNQIRMPLLHIDQATSVEEKMTTGNAISPCFMAMEIPEQNMPQDVDTCMIDRFVDDKRIPLLAGGDESYHSTKMSDETVATASAAVVFTQDEQEERMFAAMYKFSIIFGVVVGCFIQASSLGANYVLLVLLGHNLQELSNHKTEIISFSLAWSFMTSLMGTFVLFVVRSLVRSAVNGLNHNNVASGRPIVAFKSASLVANLEFPFAFGALAGVCLSWAAIDFTLGLRDYASNSLLTLAFAFLSKGVFESWIFNTPTEDDVDCDNVFVDEKPLLESSEKGPLDENIKVLKEFKYKGMTTGLLVGFFIQFSSLGASFLVNALSRGKDLSSPITMTREGLLMFSLGWSFVFGTMGVAILLFLRMLVGLVCDHILSQNQGTNADVEDEEEMVDGWSISLEFFFAAGCLVGVNVAWLITDVALGLNALIWRSLGTLAVATIWFVFLARSFGFQLNFFLRSSSPHRRRGIRNQRGKMVSQATQTTREGFLIV